MISEWILEEKIYNEFKYFESEVHRAKPLPSLIINYPKLVLFICLVIHTQHTHTHTSLVWSFY